MDDPEQLPTIFETMLSEESQRDGQLFHCLDAKLRNNSELQKPVTVVSFS